MPMSVLTKIEVHECVCVCPRFGYFSKTLSCMNTDLIRTSRPHGDQNIIAEVLVEVSLSTMTGSQCKVLIRTTACA